MDYWKILHIASAAQNLAAAIEAALIDDERACVEDVRTAQRRIEDFLQSRGGSGS